MASADTPTCLATKPSPESASTLTPVDWLNSFSFAADSAVCAASAIAPTATLSIPAAAPAPSAANPPNVVETLPNEPIASAAARPMPESA